MKMVVLFFIFCAGLIKPAAAAIPSPLQAAFISWAEGIIDQERCVFPSHDQHDIFVRHAYKKIYELWFMRHRAGEVLSQNEAKKEVMRLYRRKFMSRTFSRLEKKYQRRRLDRGHENYRH